MVLEFLRDLRFGARLLRRSAGFTFIAVASLGLGIGGATAVFSLVNAIVLRTLPVPDPQELYVAQVRSVESHGEILSAPTFEHARDELAARRSAELFAATGALGMQLQPAGDAMPVRGVVQLVSGEFFGVLRQQPQAGRLIAPSDNRVVGAHPVVVISDGYWRRKMAAAPDAVGRQVSINGSSFTIIGVTMPRFFGTTLALRSPDAWVPYTMQSVVRYASNASNRGDADSRKPWTPQPGIEWLTVFARVPRNVPVAIADAVLTSMLQRERMAGLDKDATEDDRASVQRQRVELHDASTGVSPLRTGVSPPLFVLLAMVGVLLVIACGNVAGLLLARAASREREMAIRLSIGAGRGRLVRQLLAESLLLAIAGGLAGITVAVWAREGLLNLLVNVSTPIDLSTGLDWRVLGFALGISAVTGLLCGMLPAVRGTRVAVSDALKQQSRSVGAEGGRRGLLVGKALVIAQMAFCLLLLVVAGLFARSLRWLTQTDVGFDRAHVLTARVDVRGAGYTAEERQALYRRVVEKLQSIPGVERASFSSNGPLANSARISSLGIEGYTPGSGERLLTNEEAVTEHYFDTVGLRLIAGRPFGSEDRVAGSHNTIVNETMARRFFAGHAVGKRWTYGGPADKDANVIVGVVEDARYVDLRLAPPNMAYHLAEAVPDDVLADIELRTSGEPGALAETVRQTLIQAEPRLPVIEVVPLRDRIARGVTEDRMVARLTSIFGALALLLASLGLYGTISYGVSRRIAELGLRMALGADRAIVLWMVLREALSLVAAGALIGLPLAFLAARSMRTLLFGIGAADPVSFLAGPGILVAVAALAAYLPAYRASRIEPMVALGR